MQDDVIRESDIIIHRGARPVLTRLLSVHGCAHSTVTWTALARELALSTDTRRARVRWGAPSSRVGGELRVTPRKT